MKRYLDFDFHPGTNEAAVSIARSNLSHDAHASLLYISVIPKPKPIAIPLNTKDTPELLSDRVRTTQPAMTSTKQSTVTNPISSGLATF